MPPPTFELDATKHASVVDAWFASQPGAPPLALLESGLAAVWRRAERTMGAVTLAAIADRVLHDGQKQFDFIADATVAEKGIVLDPLRARESALPQAQLDSAARYVLTRFLSVLGNLTSDVLTPALHEELSKPRAQGEPS